jgi:pimeloyl-ACP methyl ester carboxylesterase
MSDSKPTIVLVHGAFADASGWTGVIKNLQRDGYPVFAPANPLRSLAGDAEYIRTFLSTIDGPIVLVGHSYGGAVITNAATDLASVSALVYVCGFALDEGEPVLGALGLGGGTTALGDHTLVRPYPGAGEGDGDGYIDPEYFKELFCDDLSDDDAAAMSVAQRPAALNTLGTPSGVPAWKTIPSWFLIGADDRTIPVEAHRAMADRAGGIAVEIASSHVAMVTHPDAVTKLIVDAAKNAVPA